MGGGMGGGMGHDWHGGGGAGAPGAWAMAMPYRPEGGVNYDGALGGNVHDSVASYQEASLAAHDVSHHSNFSQDAHGASPVKAPMARQGSARKLPPVAKPGGRGDGKPPEGVQGRGPRERRLKEGGGAPSGAPPVAPGQRGARGVSGLDKKEEIKNARQKELQAKAAERRQR